MSVQSTIFNSDIFHYMAENFLSAKEVAKCESVCKEWCVLAKDEVLWKMLVARDRAPFFIDLKGEDRNWKETFKTLFPPLKITIITEVMKMITKTMIEIDPNLTLGEVNKACYEAIKGSLPSGVTGVCITKVGKLILNTDQLLREQILQRSAFTAEFIEHSP